MMDQCATLEELLGFRVQDTNLAIDPCIARGGSRSHLRWQRWVLGRA